MRETAQLLTVRARPEPLSLDLSKTAIFVVDMQNDFCAPGGAFDRAGVNIIDIVRRLFPSISQMLRVARGTGVLVIYLKMEHQPDLSDFGAPNHPHRLSEQKLRAALPHINS
jgi:ureidoacrylate peracid hydrolase